ncbi:MAG: haloacid dehalogenase [Bacteroidetes bacterium]|nr:MAG: haloacid dehalogenase [Bacteroidota bacterium]
MKKVSAFIFDLNGTMIDDMEFHIDAWSKLLNEVLGANMNRQEVRSHMYGKNSELLIRVFGENRFTDQEMDQLSMEKERLYQAAYKPNLGLIPGLHNFLENAHANNIDMAIGSAAIPFNIDFVLDNLQIRPYFKTIVSANDVKRSKPDPETYIMAANLMGKNADECLVFEDAPKGVESADQAGMSCIVLTTMHHRDEFKVYKNITRYISDYRDPDLKQLFV